MPFLNYDNTIPQANDEPSNSQPLILENFQSIQSLIEVDHVTFASDDHGKHNKVTMPVQAASPTTLATEMALFTRTSTLSGNPEMALRREANTDVIEFTSREANTDGWTRLPSGILFKWGNVIAPAAGLSTYVFPVGPTIPVFTTVFNIQITTAYFNITDVPNGFVRLNGYNNLNFSVFGSSRSNAGALSVNYQYFAIGI